MNLKYLAAATTLGLLATAARAVVVLYPSAAVTYSTPGSTTLDLTTGLIDLDPAHVYNGSNTVYYAGSINLDSGAIPGWGGFFEVVYFDSSNASMIQAGTRDPNNQFAVKSTPWNQQRMPSPSQTTGTFNYQMKIVGTGAAEPTISLWFGANATAATEGAPDAQILAGDIPGFGSSITKLSVTMHAESWYANAFSFTSSNVASNTQWIDVATIPEPSTYAAIFGALALAGAVVIRRRKQ